MSSVLNDAFAMLFSDFLYKTYIVGTCLNCLDLSSHNICSYKEVDKSTLTVI